jgi:SRSO17 transposase
MEKIVASDKPLPELAEYLSCFDKYFVRSEGRDSLERYSTGLLSDIPRKNGETIQDGVPGTNYQRLQSLLIGIQWDEKGANQERVEQMRANVSLGDGVLIHDDTGIPKQGEHSVGVARQYCSELGKVANCQVVVTCHYADPATSWPVNALLYLPSEWTDDPQKMREAGIPEGVEFQTKPEIALALLDEANRIGIPHKAVVADASYGGNDTYLSGLEQRKEHYVNAVPCDFTVILEDEEAYAPGIQRADAALHQIPKRKWPTIRWREGTKGWLRKKFVAVRAYRTLDGERKTLGWLIGERPGYGQNRSSGDWKYYFSSFPADAQLEKMVEYVHRRWYIDRFYEDAKNELGWGDYQGRKWVGFHRHTIIVMITYSFMAWCEWKHRYSAPRSRGRPRDPFSPRRDKRRQSIQEIHRQVIDALWMMAVKHYERK